MSSEKKERRKTLPEAYVSPANLLEASGQQKLYISPSDFVVDEQRQLWVAKDAPFTTARVSSEGTVLLQLILYPDGEKVLTADLGRVPNHWRWKIEQTPSPEAYFLIEDLVNLARLLGDR